MQLRLLGPVQLQDAAGPVHVGGPKERTVLAFLAIRAGEVVPEEELLCALWPHQRPRTASRTLQSYISRIRKALSIGDGGIAIEAVPGGYRLRAVHGAIDVDRVQRIAADARDAVERGEHEHAAAALAEALTAWNGRALGEFADEAWAEAAVGRLDELRRSILEDRIDADLRCGRHALLIGELEAVCNENPYRERLWSQRMLALYRTGRQAEALGVARDLRKRLVDELGVDPGPAVQTLERGILTQDRSLEPPSSAPSPSVLDDVPFPASLTTSGRIEFVGRRTELDELNECWKSVASGACRAVFIGGEPGIGKSRLVAEFARRVHEDGALVLFGTCEEDLDVAYQPFAEALRPFVARCSLDLLRTHVRRHGGDLARIVPELAVRLADVPPPLHAEPEAERFRLFEATAAMVEAAVKPPEASPSGAATPVLLVIDDLHWATKPTLLMLRHLLRHTSSGSLLIVGLYRDSETSDVLTDTLADLRRVPEVRRIALEGFDIEGVAEYVEAIAQEKLGEAGRAFARRLHAETGGNPFLVFELTLHLVETGAIAREGDRWTATVRLEDTQLPASVREVIGRRFGRLSETTRAMLSLAAVIGPTFTLNLLERSDGLGGDALLDAIDEAVGAGMIRDVPGEPGTYTFAHALVRRTLHDELSALRRARMHRQVAEAIEASVGDAAALPYEDEHLPEIAMHYLAAAADGVADKAIEYAMRAASEAIGRAAFEEAVRIYDRALEVAEWASLTETTTVCDLLIGLASAKWKAGEVLQARATYDRVAELARRLGDAQRFGVGALRTLSDMGGFAHAMASDEAYVALLEEAIAELGDADSGLTALLMARLSVELFFVPYAEERRSALADRAVAIAERVGDPRVLLFTLHCREWATAGPDVPPSERLIRTDLILELAQEVDDVEIAYQARFLRFVSFLETGDFHRADAEAAAGRLLARRLGIPGFVPWVSAYDSLKAWIEGRLDEADKLSAEALQEALSRRADPDLVFAVIGAQGILFRYLRDLGEALAVVEPMVDQFPEFTVLGAGLALGFMQAGRRDDCARYYEQIAEHDFFDRPREGAWLLTMGIMGQVCAYLKDDRRAPILYGLLSSMADRWVASVVSTAGPMSRVLGLLATQMRRFDEAERHFEDAIEATSVTVWAPVFHAEACYDYARMLLHRAAPGDVERATDLLNVAEETAKRLRLTTLQRWIGTLREA